MKKIILVAFALLFIASSLYAEPEVVFEGTPESSNITSPESSFNAPVKADEAEKNKIIITKDKDVYYWKSKGNKVLLYTISSPFYYFVDPDENGLIKIIKLDSGRYMYMESITEGFKINTYWGTGNKFTP